MTLPNGRAPAHPAPEGQPDSTGHFGPFDQGNQRVLRQGGDDQQGHVGAVRPGLPQLVGADHEVLAEHGDADPLPDGVQVGQAAAEPAALGEHADDPGAARLVVGGQPGRVVDGRERPLGRARPLDLGDDRDVRAAQRGHHVERRRHPAGPLLQLIERHRPLPLFEVSAHAIEDLVKHAHASAAPSDGIPGLFDRTDGQESLPSAPLHAGPAADNGPPSQGPAGSAAPASPNPWSVPSARPKARATEGAASTPRVTMASSVPPR